MGETGEISVDVGGESGEYYLKLSLANPDKTYIVLNPQVENIDNKPDNLYFIPWSSVHEKALPFAPDSLDSAHISFLMGEIRNQTRGNSLEDEKQNYLDILEELKRVLKPQATLEIVDARDNIKYLTGLVERVGFVIEKPPEKPKDLHRTVWTALMYRVFTKSGRTEEESYVFPMVFISRKQ